MFDTRVRLANVLISIKSDMPLFVEKRMENFIYEGNDNPSVEVVIKTVDSVQTEKIISMCKKEYKILFNSEYTRLYKNGNKYISHHKILSNGRNASLFVFEDEGGYWLYADEVFTELFEKEGKYIKYIALDRLLLKNNAFYLHASFIQVNNKAVLFSGPSGIGKSTQAEQWVKNRNAKIINGDRTIIRKVDDEFFAFGSPFAGSSDVYINESYNIEAIVFLQQGKENILSRLDKKKAYMLLYSQSMFTGLPLEYLSMGMDILTELIKKIPVYELICTPDVRAVETLEKYIK